LLLVQNYGKAVQRVRIKRILRENYKNVEESLKKGYSFVFLIKKNCNLLSLNYNSIKFDMKTIFEKASIFAKE